MSETLKRVQRLVARGEALASRHGHREMANDLLGLAELVATLDAAQVVEDYPDYWKGPAVLVLQLDRAGQPVHVLWGIERGTETPAILVTAYRPELERWSDDFLARKG